MEVKIVQKPSFRVTGMTCTTTLKETRENNTIPKLMDEFFGHHVHEIQYIKQPVQSYGISIDPPYEEWLPHSEYKLADTYSFEYMDDRFKGPDAEENVIDLYFPIQPK